MARPVVPDPPPALALAQESARQERWAEALLHYESALRVLPRSGPALEGIALAALKSNRPAQALPWLEQALAADANQGRLLGYLAMLLRQAGRPHQALQCYERALTRDQAQPGLWVNRARLERDLGAHSAAVTSFRMALSLCPTDANAWSMLSNVLRESGDFEAARVAALQALRVNPNHVEGHLNEGAALHSLQRFGQAALAYLIASDSPLCRERAVRNLKHLPFDPWREVAMAYAGRAAAAARAEVMSASSMAAELLRASRQCLRDARPATALGCATRAVQLCPEVSILLEGAQAIEEAGFTQEALEWRLRSAELAPRTSAGYRALGAQLARSGNLSGLEARWSRAVMECPEDKEALVLLGLAAQRVGRPLDAVTLYQRLVAHCPDQAEAHFYLGSALSRVGYFDEAQRAYEQVLALEPERWVAFSNLLFTLHFNPKLSREDLLAAHQAYGQRLRAHVATKTSAAGSSAARPSAAGSSVPRSSASRPARGRLRIGYVSPDFCAHAVAHFIEPILREHDRRDFEIICYSDAPRPDQVTARLANLGHTFVPCYGWSHDNLYERLAQDEVDILVDLAGHTAKNRLPVFARRVSPVQVAWLGYFDTTGLGTIDYRVADALSVPPDEERFFTEKVVRLPRTANCYLPPPAPDPSPLPTDRRLTFGYFNNPAKCGETTRRAFADLLHAVPDSKILFKYRGFEDPGLQARYGSWFAAQGVSPHRLAFQGHSSMQDFLRTVSSVNMALDPFPYSGETTALHCLWMGVPVIALEGPSLVQRLASRVLRLSGFDDWVTDCTEGYVRAATELARNPLGTREQRVQVRARLAASPLLDHAGVTRELESLYRDLWARPRQS